MLAFSDIIDFLLRLLHDDGARAQFDRDPQGTLARAGLEGVTGQDIRDARLQLADSGAMRATEAHHASYSAGSDPVREIGYTTAHYTAGEHVAHHTADSSGTVDHGTATSTASTTASTTNFFSIDDRDALFFQSISDDDINVTDNSVTVADAFNTDNSSVTAIQANNSSDLFNSDDDVVAIQDNDVNSGPDPITVDTGAADPTTSDPTIPDPTIPDPTAADPTAPPTGAAGIDAPQALPADDPPAVDTPAVDDTPAVEDTSPVDATPAVDDTPDLDSAADDADDLAHG